MTEMHGQHQQVPKPSWWSRNWKWVFPVGCLVPMVLCGGCFTIIFTVAFGALKSSEVYQEAVFKAKNSQEVKKAIGEPVEEGFLVTGQINISGATGHADLAIPISGPSGSATIHAVADKQGGWTFSVLEVLVNGTGQRIDLMTDE